MKRAAIAKTLGAALTLSVAACGNEPEETPDITEAIPVDESDQSAQIAQGDEAAATPSDPNTDPDQNTAPAQSAPPLPRTPPLPSTMESGSNADGGRAPDPNRTKLIPAD